MTPDRRSDAAMPGPAGMAPPAGVARPGSRLVLPARAVARRCVAIAASAGRFDRPIFILAPPRSGSSFLFECIAQFEETIHLQAESDYFWWLRFPYSQHNEYSDYLGSFTSADARFLCRHLYRHAVINCIKRRRIRPGLGHLLGLKRIRYLDKTIANCFHLEVLEHLFPDAHYVHLVRDPRSSIASMIEGWPHVHRFGKPHLTPVVQALKPRRIEHWTYPAPPGWQRVVNRPLAEICAWSWQQHVEHVLGFFDGRPRQPIRITYEQLVDDPAATVRRLGEVLGLRPSERVERYARLAPPSRTTLSPPVVEKWRSKYRQEIDRVLPMIQSTAGRIGYDLKLAVTP